METYKLTRADKNGKFEYIVTNGQGDVVSKRSSKNEYIACTIDCNFFFGRIDLVGKGCYKKALEQYLDSKKYFDTTNNEGEKKRLQEKINNLQEIVYL